MSDPTDVLVPMRLDFPVIRDMKTRKAYNLDGKTEINFSNNKYAKYYGQTADLRKFSPEEFDYVLREYVRLKEYYDALSARLENILGIVQREKHRHELNIKTIDDKHNPTT